MLVHIIPHGFSNRFCVRHLVLMSNVSKQKLLLSQVLDVKHANLMNANLIVMNFVQEGVYRKRWVFKQYLRDQLLVIKKT